MDVREFIDSELFVISVQDAVISEVSTVTTDAEGVETVTATEVKTVLNTRMKQLTFAEVDALEAMLPAQTGSYMQQRLKLLQQGLLVITQTDAHPIYFSQASDWEIV